MELTRRRLLLAGGGGLAALGTGRAAYNTVLGYDRYTGTNLQIQDLDAVVRESLQPARTSIETDDAAVHHDGWTVEIRNEGTVTQRLETGGEHGHAPRELARSEGLPPDRFAALLEDLDALHAGTERFEYGDYEWFFETLAKADRRAGASPRPDVVEALRGRLTADPATVEAVVGVDPADPLALLEGLVDAFREHSSYDIPRYAAGSVQDNVIFGAHDLRQYFESPADFEALAAGENTGMFCTELTRRSMEALHAVPAIDQTAPVGTAYVSDRRHKHAYTMIYGAYRSAGDGALVIPVTFVDYTYSTLYDDLRLTGVLGEGLDAWDDRHRADRIYWIR